MKQTDKEVLELCKSWFEDIMERSERLTSGNVSHGSRAIYGTAKNYAEFLDKHLRDNNYWKPSEEQLRTLNLVVSDYYHACTKECDKKAIVLKSILEQLEQL